MKNPIINKLIEYKLISKSNLITISNKTRDKKIRVIKDLNTRIIFLEKCITSDKYYSSLRNYEDHHIEKNIAKNYFFINLGKLDDDSRRVIQFKKYLKNKEILDFGCGWGGFLKKIKKYKSLSGVELRKKCINFIKKNIKKVSISNNINSFNQKFDVITMFHVLEHIPDQAHILQILRSKLKKNGKIIIEVPHAEDFLILQNELTKFNDFTFWSEHLILHTVKSLKTFLKKPVLRELK